MRPRSGSDARSTTAKTHDPPTGPITTQVAIAPNAEIRGRLDRVAQKLRRSGIDIECVASI
jgi:hypothetical protein